MNILIIAALWPEPTSSAAGRRMVGLLELFCAQGWALTYACTASMSEHSYPLESLSIERQHVKVNDSAFDTFITQVSPDIVLYDRFMVEEQFSWRVDIHCPQALTLLETSDLHCLRQARQEALKNNREFETVELMNEVAYREIASIQRTDLTLMISSYEMELLKTVFNIDEQLIHYFPFIVDAEEQSKNTKAWPSFNERKGFMCIGNFKHPPNWDSVQYLKQQIWPLIRQKLPNAELSIYGAYPPQKAMQLNKPSEGFYIKGRANDAKEVMQQARICLAPLRFGAGLKGKLLEAMECGTPSITTTIGAEAMHDALPWNGEIVNEPEAFANAAVALHEDEKAWQGKQQNGINILKTCYSPVEFEQPLIEKIMEIKGTLINHRQKNFQGQLLKHHSMRSTKFMSLWIEAKNKGVET